MKNEKRKSIFERIAARNTATQATLTSMLDQAAASGYEIPTAPVPKGAGVLAAKQHLELQIAAVKGARALHERQKATAAAKVTSAPKPITPAKPAAKRAQTAAEHWAIYAQMPTPQAKAAYYKDYAAVMSRS
jgi:hypothetical protein